MLGTLAESQRCAHCGLPIGRRPVENRFCCSGCKTVYAMLHELGLEKYYDVRERLGESGAPARVEEAKYAFLDHPMFRTSQISDSQATLRLEGVHCSACVWVLEKLPEFTPGVLQSRLDFGRSEITIDFDPEKLRLSTIASRLNQLGYPPRLVTESRSAEKEEHRSQLLRIGVAGFCAANSMMVAVSVWEGMLSGITKNYLSFFGITSVVLSIPAVFYSALPFYRRALQGLRAGVLHMDLPISGAILLGFAVSTVNALRGKDAIYFDSLNALIFLLLVGRYVQWNALARVRRAIEASSTFLPEWVVRGAEEVPLQAVALDDVVRVAAQARIPVDGVVVEGVSSVDRAILTGETKLFTVSPGSEVLAGSLNMTAPLTLRVTATGRDTQMGKIGELVRQATHGKSEFLQWVDRVSRGFIIGILALSAVTFTVWIPLAGFEIALDRVLALLIVSCPCALGLATPLAMSLAVSAAARSGILLKSVDVFEKLLTIREVFFDKTGTLTRGELVLERETWLCEAPRPDLLQRVLDIESQVRHPIADSICRALEGRDMRARPASETIETLAGKGVRTEAGLRIGSLAWMRELGVRGLPDQDLGTAVVVAEGQQAILLFELGDELRPEARDVVQALTKAGKRVTLLSGDTMAAVTRVAEELGLPSDAAQGELGPADKLKRIGAASLMVGDGVNDSAALAAATVGVGFTGGAQLTLQSAPVCLTKPDLRLILRLFEIARGTRRVILRNFGIALTYNLVGSALAVAGVINPLWAAILMPINSLTVVTSALTARVFRRQRSWN